MKYSNLKKKSIQTFSKVTHSISHQMRLEAWFFYVDFEIMISNSILIQNLFILEGNEKNFKSSLKWCCMYTFHEYILKKNKYLLDYIDTYLLQLWENVFYISTWINIQYTRQMYSPSSKVIWCLSVCLLFINVVFHNGKIDCALKNVT